MKTSIKRVPNAKALLELCEDKQVEGFTKVSESNNMVVLEKRKFGKAIWHIVLFVLTVWWTLGLGNLSYLIYSYFVNTERLEIKVEGK